MQCQTQAMADSTEPLSIMDRSRLRRLKLRHYVVENIKKVIADPMFLLRKLESKFSDPNPGRSTCCAVDGVSADQPGSILSLGLKGGERIRVKSLEEIKKTLNHEGRCEGLGFMDVVMAKYCGNIYTVRKQIGLFFDERNWRMQKLRRVVILDEVFCELPAHNNDIDWAGCDRTCYLFWKEAWLERLGPEKV